jgi:hypothetical protein
MLNIITTIFCVGKLITNYFRNQNGDRFLVIKAWSLIDFIVPVHEPSHFVCFVLGNTYSSLPNRVEKMAQLHFVSAPVHPRVLIIVKTHENRVEHILAILQMT